MRVIIRCDAYGAIGLGHVVRCLVLARALRRAGDQVFFALRESQPGVLLVEQDSFAYENGARLPDDPGGASWLLQLARERQAEVVILDIRDDLPSACLEELKKRSVLIVTLDDPSERRLLADLAFYPPVPQVRMMDWRSFQGELHAGWEWVLLQERFRNLPPRQERPNDTPRLLLTFGGSDPAGLSLFALDLLEEIACPFEPCLVLGKAFCHGEALAKKLAHSCRDYRVLRDVQDMAAVMAEADLALAAGGGTGYELAVMGVPAMHIALTEDHLLACSELEKAGMAICLGMWPAIQEQTLQVRKIVEMWLADAQKRAAAGQRGRTLLDGYGSERIAQAIKTYFQQRRPETNELS